MFVACCAFTTGANAVPSGRLAIDRRPYEYGLNMNDGKHCPACRKDIGIWPVLSATLPNRIRCPHCRARLSYDNAGALMINVMLLLILLCVGSYYFLRQRDTSTSVMFYVHVAALALAAWLPIELAATFYMRSR